MAYARKLVLALQEWQAAIFGLERDLAQRKLSGVVGILVLAVLLASGEFVVVSFVVPNHPNLVAIATPTLDLMRTPTVTLQALTTGLPDGTGTPPATEEVSSAESNCVPGKLEITNPKPGDTINTEDKTITIEGSVTEPQNFGYYKYEYSSAQSENWITVQANNRIRCKEDICRDPTKDPTEEPTNILGPWDISQLAPGDYFLRLVATDNDGKALPACQISIHVVAPTPEPTVSK